MEPTSSPSGAAVKLHRCHRSRRLELHNQLGLTMVNRLLPSAHFHGQCSKLYIRTYCKARSIHSIFCFICKSLTNWMRTDVTCMYCSYILISSRSRKILMVSSRQQVQRGQICLANVKFTRHIFNRNFICLILFIEPRPAVAKVAPAKRNFIMHREYLVELLLVAWVNELITSIGINQVHVPSGTTKEKFMTTKFIPDNHCLVDKVTATLRETGLQSSNLISWY
uniref:Uncharacterized protein n=1 Tax=Oryza barthii TaxID=65489 RepID=A0A0D3FKD0_9ORYZ